MESRRPKILFLGEPAAMARLATVFKNTDADVITAAALEDVPEAQALGGFALAVLDWAWEPERRDTVQALIGALDRAQVPLIALGDDPRASTRDYGGVETIPYDPPLLRLRANAYLEIHRLNRQLRLLEGQLSDYRNETFALRESCDALLRNHVIDQPTGQLNRSGIDGYLRLQWRSCTRLSRLLSAVLVQVDGFEDYEGIYGTATAEQALADIGHALQGSMGRAEDVMGRWERDRFLAVLPDSTVEGAAVVGERMRLEVLALSLEHMGTPLGIVTATVGVCCAFPGNGGQLRSLLEGADTALRAAIADGRNTVMMYNRLV